MLARSKDRFIASKYEWGHREGISLGEDEGRVEFIECDLSDIKAVKDAADKLKKKTDRLDIVICNAGMDGMASCLRYLDLELFVD